MTASPVRDRSDRLCDHVLSLSRVDPDVNDREIAGYSNRIAILVLGCLLFPAPTAASARGILLLCHESHAGVSAGRARRQRDLPVEYRVSVAHRAAIRSGGARESLHKGLIRFVFF
jgi:hypothetical protein